MRTGTDVIVGTTIARRVSFALDNFLSNQREIQQAYPECSLVLATDEPDFVAELKEQIDLYQLKGEVITYETVKPDYARSRIWSIACGREALRRYVLSGGAEYFLSVDGDMVYAPSVINIMKSRIRGSDAVSSGYRKGLHGVRGFGNGCLMFNRKTLGKITFRCYEFKNGQEIDESEALDVELSRCHAMVNRGIFVYIKHYRNPWEYYEIEPQPIGWFRSLTNSLFLRKILLRISIAIRYNIARKLQKWLYRTGRV